MQRHIEDYQNVLALQIQMKRIKALINDRILKVEGDSCYWCGGKGYWYEQIDGPDNLRKVYCGNLVHFE